MRLVVSRPASLQGELRPPSDKSITHRGYMLAAAASSPSLIRRPLQSEDCETTLRCLEALGARFERSDGGVKIFPAQDWRSPEGPLECGNSGTTMRLLAGLIASRPIEATLTGDASLSRRPMLRIAEPLRRMGAWVAGDFPPVSIAGGQLQGIEHASLQASAQVKSCILLAGARAAGQTWVSEPSQSRDHTERMLRGVGVKLLERNDGAVGLEGGQTWAGFETAAPADVSSAAFFIVAGLLCPEGRVSLREVGLNPTRTGILDVLRQCGARFEQLPVGENLGEPYGDISVFGAEVLRPFEIGGALVPRLIDEIPVLAVLATACNGNSVIADAGELRHKESDRLVVVAEGLRAMGANLELHEDGMTIWGPSRLRGAVIDSRMDHRIAMAFAVAGLVAEGETVIEGAESLASSYPGFERDLQSLMVI